MNQLIGCCGLDCETCDAPDASADVPLVLTLPIMDEIEQNVTIETAGSSLLAVQEAAKLLDWGEKTGLGTDEISEAASTWLAAKNNDLPEKAGAGGRSLPETSDRRSAGAAGQRRV